MSLSNLKIFYKLLLLILLLSTVTAAVSLTGVVNIRDLSEATDEIDLAGGEALTGARLTQTVIRLNRGEFRVTADPSAAEIVEVEKLVADQRKRAEDYLTRLKNTAGPEQTRLLEGVDQAYAAYMAELKDTLETAKKLGGQVENSEARNAIRDSALKSRAAANDLEQAIRAYIDYTDKKAETISEEASQGAVVAQKVMIAVALGGVIGGFILGFLLARYGISRPLDAAIACLRQLAEGNLSVTIFGTGRKDEIGDIANNMQVFKENMLRNKQLEEEAEAAERRAAEERKREMNKLADDFEASVKGIVQIVSTQSTELEASAQSLSSVAEETMRQSTTVAAASEQASANVNTVSAATNELSSSISEINRQVTQSSEITRTAVDEAERANELVTGLAEAAQRIGEVVDLINDIAAQTNLLALNATIEAARAGDAGKGFAVVASEVKNLANQTAKATDEIAGQITGVQGATQQAVEAIKGITTTITRLSEISAVVASAVEEQGAATQEIARNVEQAAQGTQEVSSNIAGVTQASGETGTASSQVLQAARELSKQSERLRADVDQFIANIRAA